MSDVANLLPLYIVILLDFEHNEHDGKVFLSLQEARDYVIEMRDDFYYSRAIIGMTAFDRKNSSKTMSITQIETYGFKNSKKKVEQLNLFGEMLKK